MYVREVDDMLNAHWSPSRLAGHRYFYHEKAVKNNRAPTMGRPRESSRRISSSDKPRSAAATLERRWLTLVVPGIGTTGMPCNCCR